MYSTMRWRTVKDFRNFAILTHCLWNLSILLSNSFEGWRYSGNLVPEMGLDSIKQSGFSMTTSCFTKRTTLARKKSKLVWSVFNKHTLKAYKLYNLQRKCLEKRFCSIQVPRDLIQCFIWITTDISILTAKLGKIQHGRYIIIEVHGRSIKSINMTI